VLRLEKKVGLVLLNLGLSLDNRFSQDVYDRLLSKRLHKEGHKHVLVKNTLSKSLNFIDNRRVDGQDSEKRLLEERLDDTELLQGLLSFFISHQSVDVVQNDIKIEVLHPSLDMLTLGCTWSPLLHRLQLVFEGAQGPAGREVKLVVDVLLQQLAQTQTQLDREQLFTVEFNAVDVDHRVVVEVEYIGDEGRLSGTVLAVDEGVASLGV
jgi:hypothetical protein